MEEINLTPMCDKHHRNLWFFAPPPSAFGASSIHRIKCNQAFDTWYRSIRANKPKKTKETLESLEAKVRRYIKQHNLHYPKNKLRYCFASGSEPYIRIRRGHGVSMCMIWIEKDDIQNAFNYFKHRVREALKPEVDLRPQDEKWMDEARRSRIKKRNQEIYKPTEAQKNLMRETLKAMDEEMVDIGDKPWTMSILPKDSAERKTYPIFTGALKYFPRAIASVANQSYKGNQKHHPDKPLHWDKPKSADHADCLVRHLMDSLDPTCDKTEELTAVAWRALALLEIHLEGSYE